jgi:hypothetical protein
MKELLTMWPEPGGASRSGFRHGDRRGGRGPFWNCGWPPRIWARSSAARAASTKEIRTLMRSVAQRKGTKVSVEIVD